MQGDISMKTVITFSFTFLIAMSFSSVGRAKNCIGKKPNFKPPVGYEVVCGKVEGGSEYTVEKKRTLAQTKSTKTTSSVSKAKPSSKALTAKNENTSEDIEEKCMLAGGKYYASSFASSKACYCTENGVDRAIDLGSAGNVKEVCNGYLEGDSNSTSTPSTASTGNVDLDQCLEKWDALVTACKEDGEKAKVSCDEKNTDDSAVGYARKFTDGFSKGKIRQGAGTGAAAECAAASMMGNTALMGMDAFQESCSDSFETCKNSCNKVYEATQGPVIAEDCQKHARNDDETIKMTQSIRAMIDTSLQGNEICNVEVKEEKGLLDGLMSSIAESTKAAKICQCQLEGATADCQMIPSPDNCAPGGKLYGQQVCQIYAGDNCALGSPQFNSIPCQCAKDNSAAVCRTPAAKPAPSNFAVDLKPSAFGGIEVGGVGGSGDDGLSGINLGGGYNIPKPVGEEKDIEKGTAGGRPSNATGPGGGGGLGGGSGGDGDGALPAEDDGSVKGGLAGLFNNLKSSVGNMMGGKGNQSNKGNSSGGRNGNGNNGKYDINKWLPRGLASSGCKGSQVRCQNENIFTIMHERYDIKETTLLP